MKRWLALLSAIILISVVSSFDAQAKPPQKKSGFKESLAGVVPTEWGKLTNVSGTDRNYTLTFEGTDGAIRIIELRGTKLPRQCVLIKRGY